MINRSAQTLLLSCLLAAACQGESAVEHSPAVQRAIADLAFRLDRPERKIRLIEESRVTWRDGSIGCPRKGMMYTQALVEGTRIVLEADGRRYEYHAAKGQDAFFCEYPQPPLEIRANE
jgi:hypothetical protein